jgi:HAD superfamily hydrolase (TIGR01549 family)
MTDKSNRPSLQAVLFDYGDTLAHFGPIDDAMLVAYEQLRQKLIAAGKPVLNGRLSVPAAHELLEGVSQRFWRILNRSYEEERVEELDAGLLFRSSLEALGIVVDDRLLEEIIMTEEEVGYAMRERAPEAYEVMEALRGRGLKLGLVSNYCSLPSVVRRHAARESELLQLVDASIFSCEIGLRKPHPRIYQAVLERLNVAPEAVVFVGDRLREDVMGPKALGMRAILTHQFRQEDPAQAAVSPDAVVARLAELPAVLERWADL